jgi:carbamoyl-phosphate synthase large subunit
MTTAVQRVERAPVLLDRFLDHAIEVDVDAVCDGEDGADRRHHGAHRAGRRALGRLRCSLPPNSLPRDPGEMREQTAASSRWALGVVGLMNVQFAIQNGVVYVLEVNPRASRTAPFVSKATGRSRSWARGHDGSQAQGAGRHRGDRAAFYSVKEAVFPFAKFPESDPILGPEMKSTGEVMGTGRTFGEAYAKAQAGSGVALPRKGNAWSACASATSPARSKWRAG